MNNVHILNKFDSYLHFLLIDHRLIKSTVIYVIYSSNHQKIK